ncbi:MAG: hypothetical protein KVP17_003664 [Porospora cf. gigantea B]|uniref:uncharacterized protein n=1 Tax=Porospora cf. gigantea B TaxID=2853592 RepID=UPI003571D895|nr:MAG: hypothetical protein KVP17_003664 [Porospora cf. gigantea B]
MHPFLLAAAATAARLPYKTNDGVRNVLTNLIIEQPVAPFIAGCGVKAPFTMESNPVYRAFTGLQSLVGLKDYAELENANEKTLAFQIKNSPSSSESDYSDCAVRDALFNQKGGREWSFAKGVCDCSATVLDKANCHKTRGLVEAAGCLEHRVPTAYCSSHPGPSGDFGLVVEELCAAPSTAGVSPFDLELYDMSYFAGSPAVIPDDIAVSEGRTYYWLNAAIDKVMFYRDWEYHCAPGVYSSFLEDAMSGWKTVRNYFYEHPSHQSPLHLTSVFKKDDTNFLVVFPDAQNNFEGYLRDSTQLSWKLLNTVEGSVHAGGAAVSNSLSPDLNTLLVQQFKDFDFGIVDAAVVPRVIIAGKGLWGGPSAAAVARRLADAFREAGLSGVRVDLVMINSPRVGDGAFTGGLARDMNVRSVNVAPSMAGNFICQSQRSCTEISGAIRTGLGNGNIDSYASLPGRVDITADHIASASRQSAWTSSRATYQTAAFDTCAIDCFFTTKFCGAHHDACDPEKCSTWVK